MSSLDDTKDYSNAMNPMNRTIISPVLLKAVMKRYHDEKVHDEVKGKMLTKSWNATKENIIEETNVENKSKEEQYFLIFIKLLFHIFEKTMNKH